MTPVLDRRTAAIPEPHEASLLQLHGCAGAGTALIRIDDECATLPVRFVAGDFGGDDTTIGLTGPIRLRVLDPALVRALHQGRDLVGVGHAPRTGASDDAPAIVIEAGLPAGTGFVVNPGRSLLADLFGTQPHPVPCPVPPATTTGSG